MTRVYLFQEVNVSLNTATIDYFMKQNNGLLVGGGGGGGMTRVRSQSTTTVEGSVRS